MVAAILKIEGLGCWELRSHVVDWKVRDIFRVQIAQFFASQKDVWRRCILRCKPCCHKPPLASCTCVTIAPPPFATAFVEPLP